MRLNGPESTAPGNRGTRQDGQPSGFPASSKKNDILFLSKTLSPRKKAFARIRTRWKKRLRIFSTNCDWIFKRGMDICGSLVAIALLTPVFIPVAIWLKLDSPGPLIYRQVRVGQHGRLFYFYKFRSMYIDSEARRLALEQENESKDGVIFKMKNDPRITRCGRFIRKYSIDETPQFFNVLLGDMSLVGPRPPLPSEVAQYTLDDRKRLEILPGITCIWQISGRSDIPFREQVVLDKEYIRGQGFWKDVLILMKTIPAVVSGKGAY
jgi:lipopolysaccharide/colanic/teichoic acid biosynthesis glycosyltransferase